jgi:hypothetical protein
MEIPTREFWLTWTGRFLLTCREFCDTIGRASGNECDSITGYFDGYIQYSDKQLHAMLRYPGEISKLLNDAHAVGEVEYFFDNGDVSQKAPKIRPMQVINLMRSRPAYSYLLPPSLLAALSEPTSSAGKKILDGVNCRDWLEGLMQSGPPDKAKDAYRSEGMSLFGVSAREFDRNWGDAARTVGPRLGCPWTKAGRRKRK